MLTSAFHWVLVRLGTGDLVGTAFARTSLKYFCFKRYLACLCIDFSVSVHTTLTGSLVVSMSNCPSSPTQGYETFPRLRHHPLKVMRPSRDYVFAHSRSQDLPATPSSPTQGHETFPQLCRPLKVTRPSRDSVVTH
jgi:hypothetical protein